MNLHFSSFADAGDLTKERLILKADSDFDLGDYAVFISRTDTKGLATSGRKTAFWFPDGEVKAKDLIVIYTKVGTSSTKTLVSGATAHFFYWGLTVTQWDETKGNGAVILLVDTFKFQSTKNKSK